MTLAVSLVVMMLSLGQAQAVEPPTLEALRARAQQRMRQDLAVYSEQDLRQLEELYQSATKNLRGPDARAILQRVIEEYPKSNRAGSAMLYLAQLLSGAEREEYLKTPAGEGRTE